MARKPATSPGYRPRRLAPAGRQEFAAVAPVPRRVAAGSALFRQGDVPVGIFRLMSGRMRLVRVTPDGIEVPMHTVRPGELFAEASLFSGRYHCDAVALADSEVLLYPKAELTRALWDDPGGLWEFTAELARRIQALRARLEVVRTRSAPERVLQYLRLRSDADGVVRLDGTLKHLAQEIGLTHEALYRALSTLERGGGIRRRPGEIRLLPGGPARRRRG